MTSEIATQYTGLWPLAWQSSVCLAAGLGGSIILRRRAVRAHQILLFATISAVAIPVLARMVKQNEWGLFVAERTVPTNSPAPLPAVREFVVTETAISDVAINESGPAAQPAEAAASPSGGMTLRQIVLAAWFAISSILLFRLATRFILGLRLSSRSAPVHCTAIDDALRSTAERLGIDGRVVAHCSDDVRSPVIWCWSRRAILLIPEGSPRDESLDWRSIVCHELAHWKRRDHISGLLAELMVCILPWQPLLWWGRKRLMDLSEEACDDWVIASGQAGTRYARTLLGLTPQGHAALVPAVVAGRSGLGARVRRIVAGQCADPHSSLHWTLAVVAVTACLSLGIALAQTRPAPAGTTSRTALGDGAAIVQPVSAMSIRGRVLDPNGQPMGDDPVAVTALPVTCYAVRPNSEGDFELPWSPDSTSDGQTPRLLVRDEERDLAALVEIQDPSTAMIVRPEPAVTITGRVVDPNGRPIPKALTMLSLADRFACRAPLAAAGTNDKGEFKIEAIPCRQAYRLSVQAEGHVMGSKTLSATDTSARALDTGTIALVPRRPGQSDENQCPNPNWKEDFQRTYRLDEGEVLKLVKPPFLPARQDYEIDAFLSYGFDSAAENLQCVIGNTCYVCSGYFWEDQLKHGAMFAGQNLPRLQTVLNSILVIPDYDLSLSEEMQQTLLPKGDWIVRKGASTEERLKALEQILASELRRPIHFECRPAERDTIVVTGRYAFTPLPDKDPDRLLIFSDREPPTDPLFSGEADSLSQFLDWLADGIDVAIDNKSEAPADRIPFAYDPPLWSWRGNAIDKEKDLPPLLDNLARQTGLQFKVERRTVPMWFVVEKTDG
ncbi:MAG: M56 family metallopeptidase [Phycisphaerales bacterium]